MKSHGFAMRETGMDEVRKDCEENCACMDECIKAGGSTARCNTKCQHATTTTTQPAHDSADQGSADTGNATKDADAGNATKDAKETETTDKGHHECYGVNWLTCKFTSGCRCDSNWNTWGEWLGCGATGCQPA